MNIPLLLLAVVAIFAGMVACQSQCYVCYDPPDFASLNAFTTNNNNCAFMKQNQNCTATCESGYSSNASFVPVSPGPTFRIQCIAPGVWAAPTARCVQTQCLTSPSSPAHTLGWTYSPSQLVNGRRSFGVNASTSCAFGYVPASFQTTCTGPSGIWSPDPSTFICRPSACFQTPSTISPYASAFGSCTGSLGSNYYSNASTCTASCSTSQGFIGPAIVATCLNGVWQIPINTCVQTSCASSLRPDIANTQFDGYAAPSPEYPCARLSGNNYYQNGTLCAALCDPAFNGGPIIVQCLNSQWVFINNTASSADNVCVLDGCTVDPPFVLGSVIDNDINCNQQNYYDASYPNGEVCTVSTCAPGFAISNNSYSSFGYTCTNNRWVANQPSNVFCEQVACLNPTRPVNTISTGYVGNTGNSQNAPFVMGTNITFTCNSQSVLISGTEYYMTCLGTSWSSSNLLCGNDRCNAPVVPVNGRVGGNCSAFPPAFNHATCISTCDNGFTPTAGANFITRCDGSKMTWSAITGTCRPNGCTAFPPTYYPFQEIVDPACNPVQLNGANCDIQCKPGSTLIPKWKFYSQMECRAGTWRQQVYLPDSNNYNYDYSYSYGPGPSFPSMCEFNCRLSDFDITNIVDPNAAYGSCIDNQPGGTSCQITCAAGYSPIGSAGNGDFNYLCSNGTFVFQGQNIITCVANAPLSCGPFPCDSLDVTLTTGTCGGSSYLSGSKCVLGCAAGFSLTDGDARLTSVCQDGRWTVPYVDGDPQNGRQKCFPDCSAPPTTFDDPGLMLNGCSSNRANPPAGTTCETKCRPGFSSIWTSAWNIQCDQDGQWGGPPMYSNQFCEPELCVNNPVLPNGYTLGSVTTSCYEYANVGDVCNLGCAVTHTVVGSLAVTCQAGGTWSTPVGHCYPKCGSFNLPNNGVLIGSCRDNLDAGGTCYMTCPPGKTLQSGSLTATCGMTNGVWSIPSSAVCVSGSLQPCPARPNIISNAIANTCPTSGSSFTSGTSCAFACNPSSGATQTGSLATSCVNGFWTEVTGSCDIPPQLCRPSSLSSFIAPSRSAYTIGVCPATSDTSRSFPSGNSCDLACADGYQLSASASLLVTCNDGSWSGAPSGTCVPCTSACQKCNAGPAITTGYVLDSCSSSLPYSPQTSCTLACAEGYVVRDTSSTGGGAGTFVTLCDGSTGTFPPITATCVKKESSNSGGGGSNTGAIAGGVIGAIVAIALLAAAVIYRRRKNSGKEFEMK